MYIHCMCTCISVHWNSSNLDTLENEGIWKSPDL